MKSIFFNTNYHRFTIKKFNKQFVYKLGHLKRGAYSGSQLCTCPTAAQYPRGEREKKGNKVNIIHGFFVRQ